LAAVDLSEDAPGAALAPGYFGPGGNLFAFARFDFAGNRYRGIAMKSTFDLLLVMWIVLGLGYVAVFLYHHAAATLAAFMSRRSLVEVRDHVEAGRT